MKGGGSWPRVKRQPVRQDNWFSLTWWDCVRIYCALLLYILTSPVLLLLETVGRQLKRGLMACGLGPRRWFRGAQPAAMHRRVLSEEGGCHD